MRVFESLLIIGGLYDIKVVIDRVEESVMKSQKYSAAVKLLFADKHDTFRFIKLHASPEYEQLSEATKSACAEVLQQMQVKHWKPEYYFNPRPPMIDITEGQNLMEGIDAKDLVASGCFLTNFCLKGDPRQFGSESTKANDIGGLLWALNAKCEVRPNPNGKTRYFVSLMLVANEDRPSKFDWTAEGIVEIEAVFLAKGVVLMDQSDPSYDLKAVDENRVPINPYSTDPYPVKKQFTFALDSNCRKRVPRCICVVKPKRRSYEDEWGGHYEFSVKTRIHLTKVTGVRQRSHFDFAALNPLSDAVLIVEDQELHVNKQYLSSLSTVFRTMFDDKSTEDRFILKKVKYQDCVEFLRWIYPSSVKNFEEEGMSRMLAMAKRFNVPFVIAEIASVVGKTRFLPLIIVIHFGYEASKTIDTTCAYFEQDTDEDIDWKLVYRQIEKTAAYKEMDNEKAREMLEWLINKWSKTEMIPEV
ncbi:hypothetical protein PMAYCL1PPCAC_01037 [Pristionchus mayeri]|uniref:BTB domain-containing protein n=1 Tax=Pristionchus mayeri TaxID=1317129 RepID=A0AAN5C5L0_9BILA|nr:hypothetical protein PMAYCL1PPCAC_01037 [Pristionchus mayeri]